jgi:hypothetical protein
MKYYKLIGYTVSDKSKALITPEIEQEKRCADNFREITCKKQSSGIEFLAQIQAFN